jgi:hypothetical protein
MRKLTAASCSFANVPYSNNNVEWKHSMIFVWYSSSSNSCRRLTKTTTNLQEKTEAGLRFGVDTDKSRSMRRYCCVAIFCVGLSVTLLSYWAAFWFRWRWQIGETLQVQDTWDTTFCTAVHDYQRFVGASSLHLRHNPRRFTLSSEFSVVTIRESVWRHIIEDLSH